MRRRSCGLITLAWSALSVSACLTSNVQVTVRPDGSGHVEQTTLVRPAALAEFERLTGPDPAARLSAEQLWAEIQKRARTGVMPDRRVTPVNTGDTMGIRVAYDFPDITGLRDVDLLPQLPGLGGFWSVPSPDVGASTRLQWSLDPVADGVVRLTVHFPRFRVDPSTEPPSAWASGSAAELSALKNVMRGARLTIAVATEAPLLGTSSPFRDGNRVTLLDADLAEALFSKDVQRMAATPGTFDELLSWLATVPGVTLAPEHDVTLDFQNASSPTRPAAPGPPRPPSSMDTEVFLAPLTGRGATLAIGPPINISNSAGYDNQPAFSADGGQIFFASERGTTPPSSLPRTDIFRYEIVSRRVWRITQTAESEFSPAAMPDGTHLSMVRVEADGTQHLCSLEPGSVPRRETAVMLPHVSPVGYHAWIDDRRVALYVLGGAGQPSTLQIADVRDGSTRRVAADIGRSLQRTPSGSISFVQREKSLDGAVTARIHELDVHNLKVRALVRPAAGTTDPYLTWLPDGTALMAAGSAIYRWRTGDPGWSVVAHLDGFGLHNVSRLAASPKGDRLAIVAQK